tara:strand:+ start:3577 stop:3990 length:414 start_codon:yes stop_codon:yes gene_type:complete
VATLPKIQQPSFGITQEATHIMEDTEKTLVNNNGGTYYVISAFGWCQDANPFRAFMRLAERSYVTGSFPKAKDRKADGSLVKRADDGIFVYYVKDDSKVHGMNWYRPVDKDNNPLGILVYGGDANTDIIGNLVYRQD